MLRDDQIQGLIGGTAVDEQGDKVGKIGMVYLDDQSGKPEWATVNTGFFGTSESFVPLAQATAEGDTLRLPYSKDKIKDAPTVDADRHLDAEQERELYSYYGLDYGGDVETRVETGTRGDVLTSDAGVGTTNVGIDRGVDRDDTVGHDTSGPTTDDAMTRSEERLDVGTEQREAGRARLRKYVVTEQENVTVPVTREEVRVEREPITDANVDKAMAGPAISEEEHEVVLREERPVVEKEAVPVERVRLEKETVTDEAQVSEEVRKERIETEGDTTTGRGTSDERR
jgi:uncharacterized protein (TIGR02271 family)